MSSTLHNRSRTAGSNAPITVGLNATSKRSPSKSRNQHSSGVASLPASQQPARPQSALEQRHTSGGHHNSMSSTGSSPPGGSARETFLNYFFGQNGPGPIAGSSIDRGTSHGGQHSHSYMHSVGPETPHIVPVGRDVSGESGLSSGLMAGKRTLDSHNAAYDMKSLGKHIEAVNYISSYLFLSAWLITVSDSCRWRPAHSSGRDGNTTNTIANPVVL